MFRIPKRWDRKFRDTVSLRISITNREHSAEWNKISGVRGGETPLVARLIQLDLGNSVSTTELQMTEQKSTNPTSSFSQSRIAAMKNEESTAPQLNTDAIFAP